MTHAFVLRVGPGCGHVTGHCEREGKLGDLHEDRPAVPRCDGCRRWKPFDWAVSPGVGGCQVFEHQGAIGLVTEAGFGCVQWEARDAAPAL